ncbi:peroxiredoxin [Streptomyces violaceusniger]|uniref:thioredoxin-dependent peroxiredoxin n=1 Tax=Streptomyces violaceusniger (strain Tu 4113) TaxID=653045 RepID=G2P0E9_STRV4|nr:peroxiredoxin [Streptomyces violaceusniger]AEM85947.1 alkyl hydroperoxide reductase/ Thiol specific antioxidant/ Mal allergen [Streptomyces violaceusniger Tu 4113]
MAGSIDTGNLAPEFVLSGGVLKGDEFTRGTYTFIAAREHPLVLAFYPQDNSGVCTKQLCSYSSGLEQFTDLGAEVWGISPQDVDSHEEFARKNDLRLPLLSDPDREVARLFGIAAPGVGLRRSVFLIVPGGRIAWKHTALVGLTYQPLEKLTAELALL